MSEILPPATSPLDEMADRIADAVGAELFPALMSDVDFRATVADYLRCAVRTIAAVNDDRTGIGPASPESGRWPAQSSRPVNSVRDSYSLALRQVLDRWTATRGPGAGAPEEEVGHFPTPALAVTEHADEATLLRRNGDLRRRDLVTEVLAIGAPAYPSDLGTALGYRLDDFHLCVVIGTPDRARAADVLRRAQTGVGATNRLLVPLDPTEWTGWLGSPTSLDARTLRDTLAGSGVRTAVGGPRHGADGFRRAHAEARRAEELRTLLGVQDDSLAFPDVALESLLLHDVPAATAFTADQLGELDADTPRAERMRETLLAWLSTGSQTAAATRLGLHLNSLRLRLATAAAALGPDYLDHRTELLVALRIRRALGRGMSTVDGY